MIYKQINNFISFVKINKQSKTQNLMDYNDSEFQSNIQYDQQQQAVYENEVINDEENFEDVQDRQEILVTQNIEVREQFYTGNDLQYGVDVQVNQVDVFDKRQDFYQEEIITQQENIASIQNYQEQITEESLTQKVVNHLIETNHFVDAPQLQENIQNIQIVESGRRLQEEKTQVFQDNFGVDTAVQVITETQVFQDNFGVDTAVQVITETQVFQDNFGFNYAVQIAQTQVIQTENFGLDTAVLVSQTQVVQDNFGFNNATEIVETQVFQDNFGFNNATEIVETQVVQDNFGFNNATEIVETQVVQQFYPQKVKVFEQLNTQVLIDQYNNQQQQIIVTQKIKVGLIQPVINTNFAFSKQEPSKINPQLIALQQSQMVNFKNQVLYDGLLQWKPTIAQIGVNHFYLNDKVISYTNMDKLKVLLDQTHEKFYKIKVSAKGDNHFFAAQIRTKIAKLPLQYIWFSKLVMKKIQHLGIDIKTIRHEEFDESMRIDKFSWIEGFILKKSQHLGKWQKRYVVINPDGLFSYKNVKGSYSFSIPESSVKYIWTRFQFEDRKLIIKIKHGLQQTQFAIPLMNYTYKVRHNWLYQFYRLMVQRKMGLSLNF